MINQCEYGAKYQYMISLVNYFSFKTEFLVVAIWIYITAYETDIVNETAVKVQNEVYVSSNILSI